MSTSGAIRAGKAYIEIFGDNSPLVRSLKASEKLVTSWGQNVTRVGAAVFGAGAAIRAPLDASIAYFSATGSALNDMSVRTGIGAEALSELSFAAEQTGTELNAVEGSIRKMQKAITDASNGSKEQQESFRRIGVNLSDLKGLKPEDQFRLIAIQIAAMTDPTKRAGAAMSIFGKSGTALLPMIMDLEKLDARAKQLGLTISGSDVAAADELGDSMDELWSVIKRGSFAIGASLAPSLAEFLGLAIDTASQAAKWIDQNRGLVVTLGLVGSTLLGVGGTILGIGIGIQVIGVALGGLASLVGIVGTLSGALAFLASPVGIAVAAIVGAGVAVVAFEGELQSLWSMGSGFLGQLSEVATSTFGGIADALKTGDIKLAGEILWAGLKMVWVSGIKELNSLWLDFSNGLENVFGVSGIELLNTADTFLSSLWQKYQSFSLSFNEWFANNFIFDDDQKQTMLEDIARAKEMAAPNTAASNQALADRIAARNKANADRKAGNQTDAEKEAQAELDKLAGQFNVLTQAAKDKADLIAAWNDIGDALGPENIPGATALGKVSGGKANGTFSSFGAMAIGSGGSVFDKTAENTKQTAKNTKKLTEKEWGVLLAWGA